jgi:hypothetical protein
MSEDGDYPDTVKLSAKFYNKRQTMDEVERAYDQKKLQTLVRILIIISHVLTS